MITNALFTWTINGIAAVLGLLPESPPEFTSAIDSATSGIASVSQAVAAWGFLIPFPQIAFAFVALFIAVQIALIIRFIRITASFLTLGGGM